MNEKRDTYNQTGQMRGKEIRPEFLFLLAWTLPSQVLLQ